MDDFIFQDNSSVYQEQEQVQPSYFSRLQLSLGDSKINDKNNSELKDTAASNSLDTDFWQENPVQFYTEGLFQYQTQQISNVLILKDSKKQNYISIKEGNKAQTKDLSLNLKVLTENLLAQSICIRNISKKQYLIFLKFKASKGNLQLFRQFFGLSTCYLSPKILEQKKDQKDKASWQNSLSDNVRNILIRKLSSSDCIKKIMNNPKMLFHNKLICIKYLQVLRKGCANPANFISWKNI